MLLNLPHVSMNVYAVVQKTWILNCRKVLPLMTQTICGTEYHRQSNKCLRELENIFCKSPDPFAFIDDICHGRSSSGIADLSNSGLQSNDFNRTPHACSDVTSRPSDNSEMILDDLGLSSDMRSTIKVDDSLKQDYLTRTNYVRNQIKDNKKLGCKSRSCVHRVSEIDSTVEGYNSGESIADITGPDLVQIYDSSEQSSEYKASYKSQYSHSNLKNCDKTWHSRDLAKSRANERTLLKGSVSSSRTCCHVQENKNNFMPASIHWLRRPVCGVLGRMNQILCRTLPLTHGSMINGMEDTRRACGVYSTNRVLHCSCGSNASSSKIEDKKSLDIDDMRPVSPAEIRQFLNQSGLSYKEGYTCYITSCAKHCRRRLKLNELDRLYINMTTGYFVCHSCKISGSWSSYKENTLRILDLLAQKKRLGLDCMGGSSDASYDLPEDIRSSVDSLYNSAVPLSSVSEDLYHPLLEELGIQALSIETLESYKVKVTKDGGTLVLPMFSVDGTTLIGVRLLTLRTSTRSTGDADNDVIKEQSRIVSKTIPKFQLGGLFGWNLVKPSNTEVVLTANEMDAMAVRQVTGQLAIALPKGDSSLPQKVLPMMEQFQKIVLWFGGDLKMWDTARHFARKLNERRCHLIRPDENRPGALVALSRNLRPDNILRTATSMQHKSIVTFRNLRQDVFTHFSEADQITGIKWTRYPQLNTLLKGHRRGELTVFTGPTGSGKTTFISDYSLDLSMQGVNTLWGSFEINNVRLIKTMLTQFAQINLTKNLDKFDEFADQFELLPMYFMTFHGQENIRHVIETMSHAVYVHDIAHVVVDNLQFMLGVTGLAGERSVSNSAADRFYRQDQVIAAFRKFATHMNCHVTLVIHPRKERDADDLTVASIFGSAKVSQEADNVLILQDKRLTSLRGRKYVQVAKNRFDGELGIMLLKFDKDSLSFSVKQPKDGEGESKKSFRTQKSDSHREFPADLLDDDEET